MIDTLAPSRRERLGVRRRRSFRRGSVVRLQRAESGRPVRAPRSTHPPRPKRFASNTCVNFTNFVNPRLSQGLKAGKVQTKKSALERSHDSLSICSISELQTQVRGWVLASVDGSKMGLVPSNYIRVIGRRRGRTHAQSEQGAPSQSRPASAAGSREASAQDSSQQQCDMDSAWEAQN